MLRADIAVRSTRIVIIAICRNRAARFSAWKTLYDDTENVQNPLIRCFHDPPTAGGGLPRRGSSSGKYALYPVRDSSIIKVTEKIEDLMGALFLPLYFTLSGLNTNLGMLDNGVTWGYLTAVTLVAFTTKFIGCACAARLNRLVWPESFSIGSLVSCKGLVELIVLSIGLQAKILSTRVFTMLQAWKRGEIDWDTGKPIRKNDSGEDGESNRLGKPVTEIGSLLIYLRLDNISHRTSQTHLLLSPFLEERPNELKAKVHPHHEDRGFRTESLDVQEKKRPIVQVHGVRIVHLTSRQTSVMSSSEIGELSAFDPVLNAFRVLGQLYNVAVSGEVAVVLEDSYAEHLVGRAAEEGSDLLLLPWTETGSLSKSLMVSKNTTEQKMRSDAYSKFIAEALKSSKCTTAIFVNRAFSGSLEQSPMAPTRHILAKSGCGTKREHITKLLVRLALQLADNPEITITMVHYMMRPEGTTSEDALTADGGIVLQEQKQKIRVSTFSRWSGG